MGLSYKVNELPTTLREGEFAVVDGVTYVGNSANEPVPVKGYLEYRALLLLGSNSVATTVLLNELDESVSFSYFQKGKIQIEDITLLETSDVSASLLGLGIYDSVQFDAQSGKYLLSVRDYSGAAVDYSFNSTIPTGLPIIVSIKKYV